MPEQRTQVENEQLGTQCMFYAALGGYSLPAEGFSINKIIPENIPDHAAKSLERIAFFLDLVSNTDN